MSTKFLAQVVRDAVRNQQFDNALAAVSTLRPIDLADVLGQLNSAQTWALLQRLPNRAEVFAYLEAEPQVRLAGQAPRGGLAPLVGGTGAAEGVDLFQRFKE